MLVDDFDFHLPEDRIALRPVIPRDSARLLTVRGRDVGVLDDLHFSDLPGQLRPGDVLVVNDTRVIPAQLFAKVGEAAIGVTLHKRETGNRWWSFVKNARRLKPGTRVDFSQGSSARGPSAPFAAALCEAASAAEAALQEHLAIAADLPLPCPVCKLPMQVPGYAAWARARHQAAAAAGTAVAALPEPRDPPEPLPSAVSQGIAELERRFKTLWQRQEARGGIIEAEARRW
jgi:S-adenosylmethionine:tRNA-ribosyltransferase-isomerase (queuine synthetase)